MKRILTVPNILTVLRVFMIPVLVFLFFADQKKSAIPILIIFVLCCITDFLDGYFARTYKQTTKFGQILDPIADKALIATIILYLVGFQKISQISIIPCVIIMCREVMISEIRDIVSSSKKSFKTSYIAKWKTALQMLAITIVLFAWTLDGVYHEVFLNIGEIMLWGSSIIAVFSGVSYYMRYWDSMI